MAWPWWATNACCSRRSACAKSGVWRFPSRRAACAAPISSWKPTIIDDERTDIVHRYSCLLEFYDTPSAYIPIETSPYIAGTPVKSASMFFGRQDIFDWVRENITHQYGENVLMLYGERRMGKTSVLYQLLQRPPSAQYLCLLFDLQLYGYISTENELLYELACAIVLRVQQAGLTIESPRREVYGANPYTAFLGLCEALEHTLYDGAVMVLMDEFGVLLTKVREGIFARTLFDFLRGVIQRTSRLTFLFTGAYEVRRMQKDFSSILFNMAKVHKISYLTESEATDLIEKPVRGRAVVPPTGGAEDPRRHSVPPLFHPVHLRRAGALCAQRAPQYHGTGGPRLCTARRGARCHWQHRG